MKFATALLLTISALSTWVYADSQFSRSYPLSAVTEVRFNAFGTVEITQGDSNELHLQAPLEVANHVQVEVSENTLTVTDTRTETAWFMSRQFWHWLTNQDLEVQQATYKLTLKDPKTVLLNGHFSVHLRKIHNESLNVVFNGMGQLKATDLQQQTLAFTLNGKIDTHTDQLKAEHLQWTVNGDGQLTAKRIDSRHLTGHLSGTVSCQLTGAVERLEWHMDGTGACAATRLSTQHAQLKAKGETHISLKVENSLNASTEGAGRINYYGSPKTNTRGSRIKPAIGGYQARIYY